MKKVFTLLLTLPCLTVFAQVEGTWLLNPDAGALGVGPSKGDVSYWSNTTGDVTTRDCLFDDEFVLDSNGTFSNVMQGNTWLEPFQGSTPEACGTPVAPHDGSNAATWSYDSGAGTLTLTGVGAHLGLPKAFNGGELVDSTSSAPDSIVYEIAMSNNNNTMTADLEIDGGKYWRFVFLRKGSAPDTTDGVATKAVIDFKLFPNPANSEINITSSHVLNMIKIRNMTGQDVWIKTNPNLSEKINVSTLPRGIYMVEYRSNDHTYIEKFILK